MDILVTTETVPTPSSSAHPIRGWRTGLLVAGDALSFVAFAAAGGSSHGEAMDVGHTLVIAAPFFAGWVVAAPLLGAYREELLDSPRRMASRTARAWVIAWPISLVLRWATAPDHSVPVSFAIIILLVNLVFLTGWRTLTAWLTGMAGSAKRGTR